MANTVNTPVEDNSVEKAIWSYVGTGLFWVLLLLSGIVIERLGISSGVLAGIVPGEIGTLRTQVSEQARDINTLKLERDNLQKQEGSLRLEISKLKQQLASAPAAAPSPAR